MTEFHSYDELTWPEVKALPRSTPFLLPLGEGYSQTLIAQAFNDPPQVFLLPPFPFGWHGSGLEVSPSSLETILGNLVGSLREDGFVNVTLLTPPGLNLNLSLPVLSLPTLQNAGYTKQLPPSEAAGKVIVFPIGHTEQHGLHLPLSTDTLIIDAIGQRIASQAPEAAFVLPAMPYGVSTHRSSFAGTMNAGGRAFEDFWLSVIDTLVGRGFDRFYLVSGHGGNSSFIVNVVKYAGERYQRIFCATAWLYLSGPSGIASLERQRQSSIGGMGHACELETSFILHLRPSLVHMERVVDETDFITTPSYFMDWVEGGALIANPPWDDDTRTGAYGAGSLATAEKGRLWLEAAVAEKVSHIHEIHEQHIRREQRRTQGFGLWGARPGK